MKDYRLSEIKAICEKRKRINAGCVGCEMEQFCFALNPASVDIEPRDMIELPCKQEIKYSEERSEWRVVWRDDFIQRIRFAEFTTEPKADAFLAQLKGDKK